jgi:hypothetical protein
MPPRDPGICERAASPKLASLRGGMASVIAILLFTESVGSMFRRLFLFFTDPKRYKGAVGVALMNPPFTNSLI